jgi:hypothetical protein
MTNTPPPTALVITEKACQDFVYNLELKDHYTGSNKDCVKISSTTESNFTGRSRSNDSWGSEGVYSFKKVE